MELRHLATITRKGSGGSVNVSTGRYGGGGDPGAVVTDEPCLVQDGGFRVIRDHLGNVSRLEYPPTVLFHRAATAFREGDMGVFSYEGYTRDGIVTKITPIATENPETLIELRWDEPLQT